jgi:hypothetical protein
MVWLLMPCPSLMVPRATPAEKQLKSRLIQSSFAVLASLIATSALAQNISKNPPPWAAPPLQGKDVPAVYLSEWKKAENRQQCAPLVLSGAAEEKGIKVRRASFYGGWAVAYDTPQQRSAFGMAGTGLVADDARAGASGAVDSHTAPGGCRAKALMGSAPI